jgi:esterase/lipase superfamily enzyme
MTRLAWILAAVFILTACARPPVNVIGVDNPQVPAASVAGAVRETVYVATSRQRVEDPTVLFGKGRVTDDLNFFRVEVSIPPEHQSGMIERPEFLPPDPRKDFLILDPEIIADKTSFTRSLDRELAARPVAERDTMLFVHGYNTDLPLAIMRAAQIKHDSGFDGIPVVFAWASAAKTTEYVYDLNSALQARDWLIDTAEAVAVTRTPGLSVVAHSMGNLLTVEAMRQDQLQTGFNSSGKLKNIILASPDIDVDLFKRQLSVFPKDARKFYVLISADDKALAVSRRLAGGVNRVGNDDAEDLAELGVTVIDLTQIDDTNSLNHGKFADSPEIVQLIGKRLNEGDSLSAQSSGGLISNVTGAAQVLTGGGGNIVVFN